MIGQTITRRCFGQLSVVSALAATATAESEPADGDLQGLLGVTTGSFTRHLSLVPAAGKLVLLDLPQIMRDELDLKVLDLMTATLPSMSRDYLEKLRRRAEDAGCIVTNLKLNQKNVDMGSANQNVRKAAIDVYKRGIDAAQILGCRWVRPLPRVERPDLEAYVSSYRELIEYAGQRGITLLIENFGWIKDDPDAIPRIIAAVGKGLDASVDTGNWTGRARAEGLRKAYPLAVTCDFKAFELDEVGNHRKYDLNQCFQIGWDAGYRGPWCFEHFNRTLPGLLEGMTWLRDRLRGWIAEQNAAQAANVKS